MFLLFGEGFLFLLSSGLFLRQICFITYVLVSYTPSLGIKIGNPLSLSFYHTLCVT